MAKYNAHGTLLKLGDALVSPTYTTVAQVTTISGPGITYGIQPVPTHDDTGGVEKLADALYDAGQVTFSIMYDPGDATHDEATGLRAQAGARSLLPYQIVYPDSLGQEDFNAYLTQFQGTGMDANTGLLMADITLEISGDITFT